MMNEALPLRTAQEFNSLKDFSLQCRTEPLHPGEPAVPASGLELRQRGNSELAVEINNLLCRNPGDACELERAGRELGPHPLQ